MMDNKRCRKETKEREIIESHTVWSVKYQTFMLRENGSKW